MDKSPSVQHLMPRRARAVSDTCSELNLVDTWRVLHPNEKAFTFFSGVHKTCSRIDFILTPKVALNNVKSCTIGDIITSDHAPIYITVDNLNPVGYGIP